jgi:hypothetical protein
MQIIFENAVHISHETHRTCMQPPNQLTLFAEVAAPYCEDHSKRTVYTRFATKMHEPFNVTVVGTYSN